MLVQRPPDCKHTHDIKHSSHGRRKSMITERDAQSKFIAWGTNTHPHNSASNVTRNRLKVTNTEKTEQVRDSNKQAQYVQ